MRGTNTYHKINRYFNYGIITVKLHVEYVSDFQLVRLCGNKLEIPRTENSALLLSYFSRTYEISA